MGYANNSRSGSLQYFKRANEYRNSTGTNRFCPVAVEARSYNHWVFVKRIKGKVVFNDYSYSNSTAKHQSAMRGLLRDLKIKIDVTVSQRDSLSHGIDVKGIIREIELAKFTLARKGLTAKTRERAATELSESTVELKRLRTLLGVSVPRGLVASVRAEVLKSETERLATARERRVKVTATPEVKAALKETGAVSLLKVMDEVADTGNVNF